MYKITVQRCGLYEPTRIKEVQLLQTEEAFKALKELIDDRFYLMVREDNVLVCELNLGFSASLQVLVESHEDLHPLGYKLYTACNAYSYRSKSDRREYRD